MNLEALIPRANEQRPTDLHLQPPPPPMSRGAGGHAAAPASGPRGLRRPPPWGALSGEFCRPRPPPRPPHQKPDRISVPPPPRLYPPARSGTRHPFLRTRVARRIA